MSKAEDTMAFHMKCAGLHPEREYRFCKERRWKFDFAFPDIKVAVEVEGISFNGKSRHRTATGFIKDCEKYNTAACLGWSVLRIPSTEINSGQPLLLIERMIQVKTGAGDR